MEWKKLKEYFADWLAKFFMVIFVIAVIFGGIKFCTNKTKKITSPVESYKIDSLTKENNKLIIEVKQIDSIKNAKVIEVKSLDNDSTLRLFYQLISK